MKIEVDQLDLDELKELGVKSWPTVEYDEEKFEVFYDKSEQCYIVAGEATIVSEFESLKVKPGDFVSFPAGIECVWDVDLRIKMYYVQE